MNVHQESGTRVVDRGPQHGNTELIHTPYLVLSGLPSQQRAKWAQALGVAQENLESNTHPELWEALRRLTVDGQLRDWVSPETPEGLDGRECNVAPGFGNFCSTAVAPVAGTLLEIDPGLHVLIFYQSPWEGFNEACSVRRIRGGDAAVAWLDDWLDYHQSVLAASASDPARIFLVNANRLGSPEEANELIEALRATGIALPDDILVEASSLAFGAATSVLLARQMSDFGAEYWDMYEALESSALLFGREPEFRTSAPGTGTDQLSLFLALWGDAVAAQDHDAQAPQQRIEDQAKSEGISRIDSDRQELQDRLQAKSLLMDEIQIENELLVRQLQQMQEELEHYMKSSEETRAALGRSRDIADRARVAISGLVGPTTQ